MSEDFHHHEHEHHEPPHQIIELRVAGMAEFLNLCCEGLHILKDIQHKVNVVDQKASFIMSATDDLKAALDTVNAKTNEISDNQLEAATALTEANDDIDKLLALVAAGQPVPPDVVAAATAAAERVGQVAEFSKAQAAFSKALAAKYTDPAPVPVPELPPAS